MKPPPLLLALLSLAALNPLLAQSYSFSFFAGTPTPFGGTDGTGRAARFYTPSALAADSAGNLYVADQDNATIRKVSPTGVVTTLAGLAGSRGTANGPVASARFLSPRSVAVDQEGNIYVGDYDAHTIRKITPAGLVSTLAGLAETPGNTDGIGTGARLRNPLGVAVDSQGNVWVADRGNRMLRKITPQGVVTTIAGATVASTNVDAQGTAARFNGMSGLTIDSTGSLYTGDTTNHVIRKISASGLVTTLAGSAGVRGSTNGTGSAARFDNPFSVAADSAGNIYVADTVNETIRKITAEGVVTLFVGLADFPGSSDGTGTSARFFRPLGVATDPAGNVYIADTSNQTIRKATTNGVVTTLAGPGGNFGSTDGPSALAQFDQPQSVAVDSGGNVLVADTNNRTIRKISPAGVVTTLAGSPGILAYQDGNRTLSRLGFPYGVSVDANDVVFFADSVYNTIRRISTAGTVNTIAGVPTFTPGAADGAPADARFNFPLGTVVDRNGNIFVADSGHTIRKIAPDGTVTTFAGLAGVQGSSNGTGTAARFAAPDSLAIDAQGNLYMSEFTNSVIRKITPEGVVTTLAGLPGAIGSADGLGSVARFENPRGLAVDAAGNVFVADSNAHIIRKITPAGQVTTIGGIANETDAIAGTGANARFFLPAGIAVDRNGDLYIACAFSNVIMKGALDRPPAVARQPLAGAVQPGANFTFSVGGTGGGLNYQWRFNGAPIPGATGSTYTVTNAQASATGNYSVDLTNSAGFTTSSAVPFNVVTTTNVGRITNLAIRSQAGTGAETLIVGVIVGGNGTSGTKPLLIRGVGPTLGNFGVTGFLADPKVELFSGPTKANENDDWNGNAQIAAATTQVGAFAFSSTGSKDAALYNPGFATGSYSVQITGNNGGTGVALAEIYDATASGTYGPSTPRLINVSARTQVGTGTNVLIAGFVIDGLTSKTVLIRAIGPTLTGFGVPGALANPKLELFSGATKIDENDDWAGATSLGSAFLAVGAFPMPAASADAALLVTLPPGSYTAQVSGVNNGTGIALVEVYDVP